MMHQTVAVKATPFMSRLNESLLVGTALTRKSMEARSMLVWGELCRDV
jgi:hypothetical protein